MSKKKYNPLLEVKQQYDNQADTILQSYKDCFDNNSEYEKYCGLVCNTVLAAISGINDEETKISLSPDFYHKELREKTILDWYKSTLSNPISYSMNDTSFQTICNIICEWYNDNEKLKNARRGIIAKIVYEHFRQDNSSHKGIISSQKKKRGNMYFINLIRKENKDEILKQLHIELEGKKGKRAIRDILKPKIDDEIIQSPSFDEFNKEFPNIIGRTCYYEVLNESEPPKIEKFK